MKTLAAIVGYSACVGTLMAAFTNQMELAILPISLALAAGITVGLFLIRAARRLSLDTTPDLPIRIGLWVVGSWLVAAGALYYLWGVFGLIALPYGFLSCAVFTLVPMLPLLDVEWRKVIPTLR